MTFYVVDASVVIKVLVNEEYTNNARALFHPDHVANVTLLLPEFVLIECTNILWKYVRFHGMSEATAKRLAELLQKLPLERAQITFVLPRALEIGLTHELAVYDSVYIALAETLHYPLITVDRRQAQAAQTAGITLKAITDFSLPDQG